MTWGEIGRRSCSVARTLSVVGDRWTLLILRDCFLGVRRFDAFRDRIGIPKATLADRLRRLVDADVLATVEYSERPPRAEYRLTAKGHDLYPVLLALVDWGNRHLADDDGPPLIHTHQTCGGDFRPVTTCSCCGVELHARDVAVRSPGDRAETASPPYPAASDGTSTPSLTAG